MNHSDQTKQITAQTEKMLIDQYERLYRLAYSYVHNEADALDIVQESACKAITQCKNWQCRLNGSEAFLTTGIILLLRCLHFRLPQGQCPLISYLQNSEG